MERLKLSGEPNRILVLLGETILYKVSRNQTGKYKAIHSYVSQKFGKEIADKIKQGGMYDFS